MVTVPSNGSFFDLKIQMSEFILTHKQLLLSPLHHSFTLPSCRSLDSELVIKKDIKKTGELSEPFSQYEKFSQEKALNMYVLEVIS